MTCIEGAQLANFSLTGSWLRDFTVFQGACEQLQPSILGMGRGGHDCDSPSYPGEASSNSFLSHTLQKSRSRGLLKIPKDKSRSRTGAFPSGSEPSSSLSSCRRDRPAFVILSRWTNGHAWNCLSHQRQVRHHDC